MSQQCSRCGYGTEEQDRFCSECGNPLTKSGLPQQYVNKATHQLLKQFGEEPLTKTPQLYAEQRLFVIGALFVVISFLIDGISFLPLWPGNEQTSILVLKLMHVLQSAIPLWIAAYINRKRYKNILTIFGVVLILFNIYGMFYK